MEGGYPRSPGDCGLSWKRLCNWHKNNSGIPAGLRQVGPGNYRFDGPRKERRRIGRDLVPRSGPRPGIWWKEDEKQFSKGCLEPLQAIGGSDRGICCLVRFNWLRPLIVVWLWPYEVLKAMHYFSWVYESPCIGQPIKSVGAQLHYTQNPYTYSVQQLGNLCVSWQVYLLA